MLEPLLRTRHLRNYIRPNLEWQQSTLCLEPCCTPAAPAVATGATASQRCCTAAMFAASDHTLASTVDQIR